MHLESRILRHLRSASTKSGDDIYARKGLEQGSMIAILDEQQILHELLRPDTTY